MMNKSKMKKICLIFLLTLTFSLCSFTFASTSAPTQAKIETVKTPDLIEAQNSMALESLETYIKMQAGRQEQLARRAHEILNENNNQNAQQTTQPSS